MSDEITIADAIKRFDEQFGEIGKCFYLHGSNQSSFWYVHCEKRVIDGVEYCREIKTYLLRGVYHLEKQNDRVTKIHARYGDVFVTGLFEVDNENND